MGSKGGGSTTQNTVSEPWKEAQPFLKNLLGDTQNLYNAGGLDLQPWTGPRVAPQSNLTQQGLQGFYNTGVGGNPITPAATSAFGDIVGGQGIYNNLDAVKQSALADIIPAVSNRFANSGMGDSSVAADAISRAATQAIAPIEYGAWDQAQNRRLSALGMAPQLAANQYLDPQMLMNAGMSQDQYTQNLLNSAMQTYTDQANRPYDELQRAASLGMGFGGMGSSSTGKSKEGGGGGTMETIGGIMQVAGPIIAAAFMSDRRLKTDIERWGKTAEGFPRYIFRYLWDMPGVRRLGVMADEVPKHLVIDLGPFKAVNYMGVTL